MMHRQLPWLVLVATVGCTADLPHEPSFASNATASVTMIGAGDIHAACNDFNQSKTTASTVEKYPEALVFILGDNAGVHGTRAEYQCYDQTWGRFKSRTLPAIGNHELNIDPTADAYYDYFNGEGVDSGAAGRRGKGYYALTHGGWRIFVATSQDYNIAEQTAWIAQDLAASPTRCTMAMWHAPLFTSSAKVKPYGGVRPMWKALYNGGADLILTGHAHQYERFAKTKWDGTIDRERGIRHFVVGTGGGFLMGFASSPHPASRKRISTHGVLKLELWPDRYAWQFIGLAGRVLDSGHDACR